MNYQQFCKLFSDYVPPAKQVGERYYIMNEQVSAFRSGEQRKPYGQGLFLGMGARMFVPSPALLRMLAKYSQRKATLKDDRSEWLFVCGRDIYPDFYTSDYSEGYVLVQNSKDENLGLAKFAQDKQGLILKNVLDVGNYLRHEKVKL